MRTATKELHRDAVEALTAALSQIGLTAHPGADGSADVVLEGPNGPVAIEVKATSVGDPSRVAALVGSYARGTAVRPMADVDVVLLVADMLPEASRDLLRGEGWGYLDRRGRLWIRTSDIVINDTDLEPSPRLESQAPLTNPLSGRVALGMAVWMLMHPHEKTTVRQLAQELDCAISTAHDALRRLQDAALVQPDGQPLTPELFWQTAEAWRPQRHYVSREPSVGDADLNLNIDLGEKSGWALSGDLGAAAWGARVAVSSGAPPDFYVPASTAQRAIRQLGSTNWPNRAATLSVAPLVAATRERFDHPSPTTPWLHWPLVHPVVVALDLAQDRSRGREILEDWNPPDGFTRVW